MNGTCDFMLFDGELRLLHVLRLEPVFEVAGGFGHFRIPLQWNEVDVTYVGLALGPGAIRIVDHETGLEVHP